MGFSLLGAENSMRSADRASGALSRRGFSEGDPPLAARADVSGGRITIGNDAIAAIWSVDGGRLTAVRLVDKVNETELPLLASPFALLLADGNRVDGGDLRLAGEPRVQRLPAKSDASRLSERSGGRQVALTLRDAANRLRVEWRGVLRDGSAYVRQEVTFHAVGQPLAVKEIVLFEGRMPNAVASGRVKGSPAISRGMFVGIEHPLSSSAIDEDHVRQSLARELPIRPESPLALSLVMGVTAPTQLRRDFLRYVERERAHPYRPLLHYNSWYDIGFFSQYDEAAALEVISAFGEQLVRQRSVTLDGFLFDDGWDDPRTLWKFNAGFPHGFSEVRRAASRFGAAPGVWMSPWGGYGEPKQERLRYGREQGFETNGGGFALSGPKYYARFRDVCFRMMADFGIAHFKIDGTGNAAYAFPGSVFDSDFDAAIHLIGEMRAKQPGLYVNLTTGTYASPFWLRHADSIWRGGEDHAFAGVGSSRQRWITYRDADTYANVVRANVLFPLNSLMLHGLIYARQAKQLGDDPESDFDAEVRSYFGSGTQLQEMYVTPALLSAQNWDVIAECARWSRSHRETLVDTHWIGGDPGRLEAYGWASWSPRGAVLTLRNPADRAQEIDIEPQRTFELPQGAPREYALRSPWGKDRERAPLSLTVGRAKSIPLAPFEVLTLESAPIR